MNPSSYASDVKDRIRIVNILFKVKLQALAIELAALLTRSFPYALFSRNLNYKIAVLPPL